MTERSETADELRRENTMRLGMIGLGRMGGNMARRLRRGGIEVAAYNRDGAVTHQLADECGIIAADSVDQLVRELTAPRILWLMLPAGEVTESMIDRLRPMLEPGDIVVDGANSNFRDSMRRGDALAGHGVQFADAGVSGGIWGLDNGYALMVGGSDEVIGALAPALRVLAPAPDRGWLHTGPVGSGHFTKMIHNGIEYGMMQAYAEGFAMLRSREDFGIDLAAVAESWRHGSVVRSWLLDLTTDALQADQMLDDIEPYVADSGEGRWTAIEAIELGVPTPVISTALMMRFTSQGRADYGAKLLALMRRGFGGHALKQADK